jgi:DNA adenine methylase
MPPESSEAVYREMSHADAMAADFRGRSPPAVAQRSPDGLRARGYSVRMHSETLLGAEGCEPFLRWAGAKRAHLTDLLKLTPSVFKTYYEPFAGSASLFFRLAPSRAVLGDTIAPLMATYAAVRDNPRDVEAVIAGWEISPENFAAIRALSPADNVIAAARFIYLNKTCFNGLYRVNSTGGFNVPYGRPKTSTILPANRLSRCAAILGGAVELRVADFEATSAPAASGDFVFFDPPYVTSHRENGFIDYNEKLFSWHDQERLADAAYRLAGRGVEVLVANADHLSIRQLYSNSTIHVVARHSTLAGSAKHRRGITELLIQVGR